MTIPALIQAANLAKDLISPQCINWQNLENNYAMNGKEITLALIEREKKAANNVYLAHLSLAETAINSI